MCAHARTGAPTTNTPLNFPMPPLSTLGIDPKQFHLPPPPPQYQPMNTGAGGAQFAPPPPQMFQMTPSARELSVREKCSKQNCCSIWLFDNASNVIGRRISAVLWWRSAVPQLGVHAATADDKHAIRHRRGDVCAHRRRVTRTTTAATTATTTGINMFMIRSRLVMGGLFKCHCHKCVFTLHFDARALYLAEDFFVAMCCFV